MTVITYLNLRGRTDVIYLSHASVMFLDLGRYLPNFANIGQLKLRVRIVGYQFLPARSFHPNFFAAIGSRFATEDFHSFADSASGCADVSYGTCGSLRDNS